MFVSINWIKDYVDLDGLDIKKLINSFTLATAEVEDIIEKGADVQNVVVGEILSVENHPNSNKLHLLKVDAGSKVCNIVCGAPNVAVGQKVALALAGGRVCAGEIKVASVAGYESEGMCCSEKELGISDDHSGIMVLDPSLENGTDIKSIYPIDDIIFEVDNKSLTNRPDLWGHYGIAREFAALAGRELKPLELGDLSYDGDEKVDVTIGRKDLVYRYSCIKMDNITKNKSPLDMRIRLYYCGMRGINLLADVTNYIMLEIGQPTHAFAGNAIDNIVVTTPKEKMQFKTLDGVERTIDEETLMICNGDTPVGIAGIMGGLESEIIEDTGSVVLESANFDGVSIRKSSSRLGHRTDASARYEKMLDPELTLAAVGRFVKLVKDIDSGARVASKLTDEYVRKYPEITLSFDKKYVDRYTGIDISDEQITKTLVSLGFGVECESGNYTVKVPSWRATKDVTIKADIIEEITRIYGYDNFEIATTNSPLKPVPNDYARLEDAEIKDILVKKYGLHEVHSYIWCDGRKFKKLGIEVEDNVKVLNIESSENGVLRNSMLPTLLSMTQENKDFAEKFGIFEAGRVVDGTDENGMCNERKRLGVVLYDKSGNEKSLYFKAVEIINCIVGTIKQKEARYNKIAPVHSWQHPKNTAEILIDGEKVGVLCALHPANRSKLDKTAAAVCFEIDLGDFSAINASAIAFREPSTQQSTYYDLSIVSPENVKYSDIAACWETLGLSELESARVIDTYEKLGIRSITVRLVFAAMDRTLEMEEVQGWIDEILANLGKIGVTLRA
ncbi:MAG: phenylalanine--tRNA ligase subunit beta [Oscillospiraceae bacterium]|nr:phenylalanine--tRNA ligase subunit beta [Oscillospiraceae bacterium]